MNKMPRLAVAALFFATGAFAGAESPLTVDGNR